MGTCDVIVIGASAGGVEALKTVVRGLPANLPAAVFIVLHVWPNGKSVLPEILNAAGSLRASHPSSGSPIERGHVYIAPPDYHMTLGEDSIRLTQGPLQHRHRPAVDPLFRSAALHFGPRVAGVILTGSLRDGTAGLLAVKKCGGKALVQDPREAVQPGMPESALAAVDADYVVRLCEMPGILTMLATQSGECAHIWQQEIGAWTRKWAPLRQTCRPWKELQDPGHPRPLAVPIATEYCGK